MPSDSRCAREFSEGCRIWNQRCASLNRIIATTKEEQKELDAHIAVVMLESEWSVYLLPEDYSTAIQTGVAKTKVANPS
jgi:hypothetical protein